MSWQDQISNQSKVSKQGTNLLDTHFDWIETQVDNPNQLSKVLQIASHNSCFVLTNTQARLGEFVCQWINQTQAEKAKFIFLDLSNQDQVVEHVHEDQVITVRTGITIKQLNKYLKKTKQWLPCHGRNDDSSILSMIESGDSGPLCTGYGPARNLVLGLETCLSDGRKIRTGGKIVKNVTGYDLTKLFVGSNSWLGVSHTVHLRLFAYPESAMSLVIQIKKTDLIPDMVKKLWQSGYPISSLEVIDSNLFFTWLESKKSTNHIQYQEFSKQFKKSTLKNSSQSAFMVISCHGYEAELKPAFSKFTSCISSANISDELEVLTTDSTNWLLEELSKLRTSFSHSSLNTNIPFAQGLSLAEKLKIKFPKLSWIARPVHGSFSLLVNDSYKDKEKLVENELVNLVTNLEPKAHLNSAVSISNNGNYSQSKFIDSKDNNQTKLIMIKNSIKSQFDESKILNPLVTF